MKAAMYVLTVVLVIAGFFIPWLWLAALFTLVLGIAASPGGVRKDGKKRTGGLLGGVWDSAVEKRKGY